LELLATARVAGPLGALAAATAILATFRFAPQRRLGSARSLVAGTIVALVLPEMATVTGQTLWATGGEPIASP
jgi:hypothetical protein